MISIRDKGDDGVLITGDCSRLSGGTTAALDGAGEALPPSSFAAPGAARAARVAGCDGNVIALEASGPRYRLVRESFQSTDGKMAALRLTLHNTTTEALELRALTPVRITTADGLHAAGGGFTDWRILRMARQKNDIPGCFTPSLLDADYEDAALSAGEIPAGLGVSKEDEACHADVGRPIICDPCLFVKNRHDMAQPGLFMGVLGQTRHLTTLEMTGNRGHDRLVSFRVLCEFDGVRVDPGTSRTTHWTLFWEEDDGGEALSRFAGMLAEEHDCPSPPLPAPSIFCTWYFYGQGFTESDLEENLDDLARSPVDFDIFLLDDGWSDKFGSWQAGPRFPLGMAAAAKRIREAGYRPGIWTCPFVVMADAPVVAEHPELLARDTRGEPYPFGYQGPKCYAIDPTSPYAQTYFNELFGRLRAWGFEAHKFDFLRAIIITDNIRFHDRTLTRAQVYRRGLEMIRQAMGSEAYMLACGGLFEGSIGLADGMRVGSDTRGFWNQPTYLKTVKQNVMRAYTNRFWHTDPDAVQVRLRDASFRDVPPPFGDLSLGRYSDEEVFTALVNQYLGGGMSCFAERFAELNPDRRAMLRHILPAGFTVPTILDVFNSGCPELFLFSVKPRCAALGVWWMLAVINWQPKSMTRKIALSDLRLPPTENLAVFEFKEQRFMGVHAAEGQIEVTIPAHGTRLLRLAPAGHGGAAMLLGTDLHLTGGGLELQDVLVGVDSLAGRVAYRRTLPVTITAGFPEGGSLAVRQVMVPPDTDEFIVRRQV